jgi:hypothetical protein
MTRHQLSVRNVTCGQLVFVVIALVAAYRASLQVATAQSAEHPTTLQWNAAKLCEKALQKKYPPSRASVDSGKRVVLNLDHAQRSDLSGDPCFRIALQHWTANGEISIQLIGPKGEIVSVVATERPIHASPEGSGTVTVPYKHRGLYPGLWLLMASGPCGIHECKVEIPKVLPLDGNRKEERLVFKTRNTLSSSLPYDFGVYEPPAPAEKKLPTVAVAPTPTPAAQPTVTDDPNSLFSDGGLGVTITNLSRYMAAMNVTFVKQGVSNDGIEDYVGKSEDSMLVARISCRAGVVGGALIQAQIGRADSDFLTEVGRLAMLLEQLLGHEGDGQKAISALMAFQASPEDSKRIEFGHKAIVLSLIPGSGTRTMVQIIVVRNLSR